MSHDLETQRLQDAEPGAADAAALTPNPSPETVKTPFIFTGKGGEYFRIWIVNLLLTIVTLGIYSAWAKVRNKQYFYANTSVDDATFSYHADPKKILLGRLIAGAFFLLYLGAEYISLALSAVMFAVFLLVLPWVVCKALRFNAANSAYRNVSFQFRGTMAESYKAFLLWPLAGALTLGVLFPFAVYKQQHFIAGRHSYGDTPFEFTASLGRYYRIYLVLAGIVVLGLVAAFSVGMLSSMIGAAIGVVLVPFVIMALYLLLFAGHQAMMANARYQHLSLNAHRTDSDWDTLGYAWLLVTNTLGIALTFGLFIPWAKVRAARYKAKHTWCLVAGNLDGMVADQQSRKGSVGEGMSDFFGIDVGI
ncbi:YjgN family protein [Marinimicrobium alkaliphilum]|uniref:YjgN family protein n=1 Tax=Marinimicrobium alkaliphilum TaxID=2202654 RepID=UPI000DB9A581|nr:YjgN family protein [Marinimicrobium alkaliphilum]